MKKDAIQMTKNKFDTIKKDIIREIEKNDQIIIHRHQRPDPDAIGSQVGLAELIKENYPDKKVFTAGEDMDTLSFLDKMNPPTVTHYEEGALVIILDTANTPRIDGSEALAHNNKIIKIDHHPNDDAYGDIQWVDTNASSTSELISDLWLTFSDDLSLTAKGARHLYAGIVGDTNRFLYQSTSPKTMRLAAALMEKDFSPNQLNNEMNEISPETARLMAYVLENIKVSEHGVGSVILTAELLESFGLSDDDTHQIVSLPGSIQGVLNWGIFVQQAEGYFRCRLRSKGPVINDIAKEHHGGGHPLASGANAKDLEEVEEILAKFEQAAISFKAKDKAVDQ